MLELGRTSLAKLPANIGKLTRLRELRLLGTKITRIPESIGALADLRVLSLPFDAEVPDSITQLAVEQFFGSKDIGARIPRRPPSTPAVDHLRLRPGDPLPADFGDPIILHLGVHADHGPIPQLAHLRRLQDAHLCVPDVTGALEALANSPRLHRLELEGVAALPPAIGALDTLQNLSLSGSLTALPDEIGTLAKLSHLTLRCPALTRVPACVADLPLETLELDLDGRAFPDASARSGSLSDVTIHCNEPATSLLALANLPRLQRLTLDGPIPDLEGLLRALATTPITHLTIGRRAGRRLPETIATLAPTLTHLDLRRTDMTRLPTSLRDCTALVYVELPAPEFGLDAITYLPAIKWTKKKWADRVRFERSKRH